ncbi:MAG: D-tyrosyl-tRNA(Tyr) deacylase [Chloroflexi bacterium]|nr:D-tyrosyl-tRNA(Tyr) deacylase [Chloroflexota bacterium]MBU1747489.1 D-tyrosyl-tRNA(Tyr) deacylase [Chloroflexota bacterium]
MRALIQRVTRASVSVDDQVIGAIGPGLVILLGVAQGDTEAEAAWLALKIANLRIFADEAGRFNRSALDLAPPGEMLVVSQFTLLGDARRGRRPDFISAAPPELAAPLVDCFADRLRQHGLRVAAGQFGAYMQVEIHNDGPVTLVLDRVPER